MSVPGPEPPSRWARLDALFAEAVDLDPDARAELLTRVRADDPGLADDLADLLRHDAGAESRLGDAVQGALASLAASADPDRRGVRLGPYRIVDELGQGGMGTVYLAERADDAYEARVAIKLVRGGIASREQVRRFKAERQILASLTHPNIARLLDGGTTSDGLPYVVMEVVEGEAIDTWCDRNRLGIRERIELFLEVCDAVAYAHRNLVVHRDVKPGNILVDGTGRPKLLDFGIARFVEPDADGPPETRVTLALTPAFASPEQVRGEAVTTGTDVYALGAVLYQLLCGQPAHHFVTRTPVEIERVVCRETPERPSVAMGRPPSRGATPTPALAAAAEARSTDPARLRQTLAGDLDAIVLTALRKEPERRYASVEALARDLRSWLDGLPVGARGDAFGYRASKFLRRNRRPLTGVGIAAALLVALVSFYTVRLATERDRARLEAAKAATMADFLGGLFAIEERNPVAGAAVTARELLDRGVETIEDLADPEVRADLQFSMGVAYHNLGLFDRATPLLRESEATIRALYGADSPETSALRSALADNLWERGDYAASDSLLRAALPGFENDPPQYAAALANRGRALQRLARWDEARAAYDHALERFDALEGDLREERAVILVSLGQIALDTDDREAAEAYLRRALALDRALEAEGRGNLSNTLQSLGAVLVSQRRLDEAEGPLTEALALEEERLGPEHPQVAGILNQLGALHLLRDDPPAALPFLRRAVAIGRSRGEDHADLAYDLTSLSQALSRADLLVEAEETADEAVRMSRATDGPDSPFLARALLALGFARLESGRVASALATLEEAMAIAEGALPPGHSFTANLRLHRGRARRAVGDTAGAEADWLASWRVHVDTFGADDPRAREIAGELAGLYAATGRTDEAARWRERAGPGG